MNARRAEGRRPFIATLRAVRTHEKCSLFCSLLHVRMFTFRCPNLFTFKRPLTSLPVRIKFEFDPLGFSVESDQGVEVKLKLPKRRFVQHLTLSLRMICMIIA